MTTAMHTLAGPAVGEMLVGAVERVTFHNAETGSERVNDNETAGVVN